MTSEKIAEIERRYIISYRQEGMTGRDVRALLDAVKADDTAMVDGYVVVKADGQPLPQTIRATVNETIRAFEISGSNGYTFDYWKCNHGYGIATCRLTVGARVDI